MGHGLRLIILIKRNVLSPDSHKSRQEGEREIYTYIYIYIEREREREREGERERECDFVILTVSPAFDWVP